MICKHESFTAGVKVTRLQDQETGEDAGCFNADVSIRCNECGSLFRFVGVPEGLSPSVPTTNEDRTELHVPILPPSQAVFD